MLTEMSLLLPLFVEGILCDVATTPKLLVCELQWETLTWLPMGKINAGLCPNMMLWFKIQEMGWDVRGHSSVT